MKIKIEKLRNLLVLALVKRGFNKTEATKISETLLYAQLRENNQGIIKLSDASFVKNSETKKIKILKETKVSALVDGCKNSGILAMNVALDIALKKVEKTGIAIVGLKNTFSSTGSLGYYSNKIAQHKYIGFVYSGSPSVVASYGSYNPTLGTNPLSIGIPSTSDPIILDMATSSMAYYGLVEAKIKGKQIPPNVALDSNGNPTSDPDEAMKGALLSFDRSYKGAGISIINEILTGPLVSASFSSINHESGWGNLIYIIDPEILCSKNEFLNNIGKLKKKIKGSKKIKGVDEIFLPGEKSNRIFRRNIENGEIEISKKILDLLS